MTVSERQISEWSKPDGRKAGELTVHVDVAGSTQRVTYPLRVNVNTGRFMAIDGDTQYTADTRQELVEHMKTLASAKHDVKWTRYLQVEYSGNENGVRLEWSIVELSDEVKLPNRRSVYLFRECGHDGEPHAHQTSTSYGVDVEDLIPYTDARRDTLLAITASIAELDKRMRAVFDYKTTKTVAKKIDALLAHEPGQMLALTPAKEDK